MSCTFMYKLFQKTNTENNEMKYVNMNDKLWGAIILDAFAKLQKATIKFVMSVRLYAWKNSAHTGGIFMNFYIWVFF
jgi:hypothetical protein